MQRFSFYHKVWVNTDEFHHKIPLVIFSGELAIGFNQWLLRYIRSGASATTVDKTIRAMGHLYDFYVARRLLYGNDYNPKHLIAEFIDAKRFGTGTNSIAKEGHFTHNLFLDWLPLKNYNIRSSYLHFINDFDKWQAIAHDAERLNPSEEHFLNSYEKFLDFKNRAQWDMFIHLDGARRKTKTIHQNDVTTRKAKREKSLKKRSAKCFPPDKFIELIETCRNPRDKLIFLILGAGSLRRCEPLNFFLDDLGGEDPIGQLKINLADPQSESYKWEKDGKEVTTTREEYIIHQFKNHDLPDNHPLRDLGPRDAILDPNDGLHTGFKGMTFGTTDMTINADDTNIYWCSPELGIYAAKLFKEYCDSYIYNNSHTGFPNPQRWPYHPYAFINITKNDYGMPLSLSALKQIWNRACKRLGITGYGLHSLRHLFAFYCANVLKIPLEKLSIMMHHSDVSSTQIYYQLSSTEIKAEIAKAHGVAPSLLNLAPDFEYNIPGHWND